jgi:hypothetical protein
MHGAQEKCMVFWWGVPDKIGLPGRHSYRWEANVKMDLKEIEK